MTLWLFGARASYTGFLASFTFRGALTLFLFAFAFLGAGQGRAQAQSIALSTPQTNVVTGSVVTISVISTTLTSNVYQRDGGFQYLVPSGSSQFQYTALAGAHTIVLINPSSGTTSNTLTINGGSSQTINFTGPGTGTFNSNATLSATATSGLTVSFSSQTAGVCTVAGSLVSYVGAGTCTIAANQSGNSSFGFAPQVTQSISVGKADQTIAFTGPSAASFNGSATLSATATSALGVSFSSQTTGVCTVSGSTVYYIAIGTCTIAANQAGNTNWNAAAQVTQDVTVAKASQTIAFTGPGAGPFNGSAVLSATAASGLAVTFSSQTAGVCTVAGSTVSYVGAGSCTIAANQAGDGNWNAATQVTQTITVSKATQAISFTGLGTGVFNGTVTLSASATSTLAVVFTSQTASICAVSGTTLTYIAVGTCTVAANQAGDANWDAAPQATQSVTVSKADQTIAFTPPSGALVSGSATLSATAASSLTVAFTSLTAGVCTVAGTTVSYVAAGTCTIAANQAGNASWNAATQVTQSITVGKGNQTISFTAPTGALVNGNAALSASTTSALGVTFTSQTAAVCTVTGATVNYIAAGTCTIAADQAGSGDWNAAPQVTGNITVDKLSQTITFTGPSAGAINGGATLSATSSSALPVIFTSQTTGVCTVSGATVTYNNAGTCTIAANQAGDAIWSPATQVTRSVSIPKLNQTISFTGPGTGAFGGGTTLTATASSGLVVVLTSQTTSVCTVSGVTLTYVGAGTCTIAANQAGDTNWNAATQVTQGVVVSKVNQTISFTGPSAGFVGGTVALSASATSALAVAFTSQTTGVCTVTGTTLRYVGVGTCTIAANQAGNANWNAATQVTQSLSVASGTQIITFTGPTSATFNATATLTATATSGLTVVFTSQTTGVCTVTGGTVRYIAIGTCTIAANQAGNVNWNPAAQVTRSVTVGKATQTISFTAPTGALIGGNATLSASATSALAVSFTSLTTGVCTVAGATVNYVTAGTCTIAANQAGDVNWNAATQVTRNITVNKLTQVLTFSGLGTGAINGSATLSASTTSGLAITFTSQTTGVCTVSGTTVNYINAGLCTVAANQAGNAQWNAATQVTQSVTIPKLNQTISSPALALDPSTAPRR